MYTKIISHIGGSINRQTFANLADCRFLSIALHAAALRLWLEHELKCPITGLVLMLSWSIWRVGPSRFTKSDARRALSSNITLRPGSPICSAFAWNYMEDGDICQGSTYLSQLRCTGPKVICSVRTSAWRSSWEVPYQSRPASTEENLVSTQVADLRFAGMIVREWRFCRRWRIKYGALHLW